MYLPCRGDGAKIVRDAFTLASILDLVQRDEIAHALDVLVMRLQALAAAKKKGGSWEKASKVELISGTDTLASGLSGMIS